MSAPFPPRNFPSYLIIERRLDGDPYRSVQQCTPHLRRHRVPSLSASITAYLSGDLVRGRVGFDLHLSAQAGGGVEDRDFALGTVEALAGSFDRLRFGLEHTVLFLAFALQH